MAWPFAVSETQGAHLAFISPWSFPNICSTNRVTAGGL
jgi:hypothetical protein